MMRLGLTCRLLLNVLPEALGALIALYAHSVYLQSLAWGSSAFDQFGVALGKQLAGQLRPALQGETCAETPITHAIIGPMIRD